MKPTTADLAFVKALGVDTKDEIEDYANAGPIGDRTVRLTVDLSNSRRLRHYGTWLREQSMDKLVSVSTPSQLTDWWVYFGTVQRERIVEIARTDAPVNDAGRDLWLAIKQGLAASEAAL